MQVQAAPGGIGLENVKRRLELIYGSGYDLDINTDNGFYNVNLIIPGL
jgi:sensor histidine kinase YesM